MKIEFAIVGVFAHAIICPKSPIEILIHEFKVGRRQPAPGRRQVVEIPDQ